MIVEHVRCLASMLKLDTNKSTFAQRVNEMLRNPMHPDRLKIESIDPGVFHCFGEGWERWTNVTQKPVDDLLVVTSLSPLPHHAIRQPICLDSWKRTGLKIVSVNAGYEIAQLERSYPQVDRWIRCDQQGNAYARPTQLINRLLGVAVTMDSPILLINSDIEIYGNQEVLTEKIKKRQCAIGIRHNYAMTQGTAEIEPYGLDAVLIYPEQVVNVPEMQYAIGRPFWDYWLPWHLMHTGTTLEWIGEPFFYHQSHPLNWTQEDWLLGYNWSRKHYGVEVDWPLWRQSLPFPPKS